MSNTTCKNYNLKFETFQLTKFLMNLFFTISLLRGQVRIPWLPLHKLFSTVFPSFPKTFWTDLFTKLFFIHLIYQVVYDFLSLFTEQLIAQRHLFLYRIDTKRYAAVKRNKTGNYYEWHFSSFTTFVNELAL